MERLRRFLDPRHTTEGKALSLFLSLVMAWSLIGAAPTALANDLYDAEPEAVAVAYGEPKVEAEVESQPEANYELEPQAQPESQLELDPEPAADEPFSATAASLDERAATGGISFTMTPTLANVDVVYAYWAAGTDPSTVDFVSVADGAAFTIPNFATSAANGYVVFFVKPASDALLVHLASANDLYSLDGSWGYIAGYPGLSSLVSRAKALGYVAMFGYSRASGTTDNVSATCTVKGVLPSMAMTVEASQTEGVKPGTQLTFTVTITPQTQIEDTTLDVDAVTVTDVAINGEGGYAVENLTRRDDGSYVGTVAYTATAAACEKGEISLTASAQVAYSYVLSIADRNNVTGTATTETTVSMSETATCRIAETGGLAYALAYDLGGEAVDAATYPSAVTAVPAAIAGAYAGDVLTVSPDTLYTAGTVVEDEANGGTWTFSGWKNAAGSVVEPGASLTVTGGTIWLTGTWTFSKTPVPSIVLVESLEAADFASDLELLPLNDVLDTDLDLDFGLDDGASEVDRAYTAGDTATFSMYIANDGDVTLHNAILSNGLEGLVYDEDRLAAELPAGAYYVNNQDAAVACPYDASVAVPANSVWFAELQPGAALTVYADYTVQEDDLVTMALEGTSVVDASQVTAASSAGPVEASSDAEAPVESARVSLNVENTIARMFDTEVGSYLADVTHEDPFQHDETAYVLTVVNNESNITLYNVRLTGELDDASIDGVVVNGELVEPGSNGGALHTLSQMAPGDTVVVYRTYDIQEGDVIAGLVSDTAQAVGDSKIQSGVAAYDLASAPTAQAVAHFTLTKEPVSTPANGTAYEVGEEIEYLVSIANDGNLVLSDVTVRDLLAGAVFDEPGEGDAYTLDEDGNALVARIVPGQTVELTVRYTATQADAAAGFVTNTATASATTSDASQPQVETESGSATVAVVAGAQAEKPGEEEQPGEGDGAEEPAEPEGPAEPGQPAEPGDAQEPADAEQPAAEPERPAVTEAPAAAENPAASTAPQGSAQQAPADALPTTFDGTRSAVPLLALGACLLGAAVLLLALRRKELGRA
jgi:uncharacterized repeat protein (TIGR01451 family)